MGNMSGDAEITSGSEALSAGRWHDARSSFEAALAIDDDPRAIDGLGEALWWLGEPQRGMQLREQAYLAFRRQGDAEAALAAALGVAITQASNFGNLEAAGGWVSRAEHLVGDSGAAQAWVTMTRAYVTADVDLAITLYRATLTAARRDQDVDLELCSLAGLGEKLVLAGQVSAGLALVDECMAATFAGEPTRLDTIAYAACDMLSACDVAFDLPRARRWCEAADRFVAQFGCPFLFARCRMVYGSLLISDGRWAAGEAELIRAGEMCSGAGPAVAADVAARLADLRLRQGRFEDATRVLLGHTGEPCTYPAQAALALRRGQPAAAVGLADRSARCAPSVSSGLALLTAVQAWVALDDPAEARTVIDRFHAGDGRRLWQAFRAAAAAHLALAAGTDAREAAEAAAADFTALRLPYEAAQARLLSARAEAIRRPDQAVAEAEAAWTTFDDLGATVDRDEAAALLRSLGATPPAGPRSAALLTRRENQVLQLVRAGLSNPEIAARLHISRKTAAHHVSGVLAKLGLRNRTEAATWVAEPSQRRASERADRGSPGHA
jgi:DNA-binding NarL/FixJ family response regulator